MILKMNLLEKGRIWINIWYLAQSLSGVQVWAAAIFTFFLHIDFYCKESR
jgi:hypothetical protein